MEERLTNLTIDTPLTGVIPDGSNLAHVLCQGLHSKDVRILHSVLSRWDENIVAATIRSLPVQLLVPLLNEIKVLLGGKAQLNHSILKWLKSVFQIHSAYLMSCTLSEDLLTPFTSLLLTREALYPQMCQLRGKLELMKGNIKAKKYCSEMSNEALLLFQDDSSGDDDDEDDGMMPSESEDFLASDDLGVDEEEDSGSESNTDGEQASNVDEDSEEETEVANAKSKILNNQNKTTATSGEDLSDEEMDDDDEG
jgi:U3 small nucleolar RNA-associated protein 5